MPKQATELTDQQVKNFMQKAQDIVDRNFDPATHLPPAVYKFLQPIANSTCQGYYSCACMLLGAMPALSNGASVQPIELI